MTTLQMFSTMSVSYTHLAAEAKKLLKDDTEPTTTITLTQGRGTATGLKTGLYLVDTPKVITPNYTYTFTPYLLFFFLSLSRLWIKCGNTK